MSTDHHEPGRCNAITRDGTPCQKWPVGGAGEGRCRFHGGQSTGPDDTSHLDDNDYAEGNAGGGAPEGNANARIHGGFADWKTAYERFDEETTAYVDRLRDSWREVAEEHAPDKYDAAEIDRLVTEKVTLSVLESQASADVWCSLDGDGPGRGLVVEKTVERHGEAVTIEGLNPASRARHTLSRRQREIAETLRLWPGFQPDE